MDSEPVMPRTPFCHRRFRVDVALLINFEGIEKLCTNTGRVAPTVQARTECKCFALFQHNLRRLLTESLLFGRVRTDRVTCKSCPYRAGPTSAVGLVFVQPSALSFPEHQGCDLIARGVPHPPHPPVRSQVVLYLCLPIG